MHGGLEKRLLEARAIERTIVQGHARLCSGLFGKTCKLLWPVKTAEGLAAATGMSVRAAAYEISGEREPSALSMHALNDKILDDYKRRR